MPFEISDQDTKSLKSLGQALKDILNSIDKKLDSNTESITDNINTFKTELFTAIKEVRSTAQEALSQATKNSEAINEIRETIQYTIETVNIENNTLRKKINSLENYSRRSNLVIRGIPEQETETPESCEQLVRAFFKNQLKLSDNFTAGVKFVRCHRIGAKPADGQRWVRAMIVRFHSFDQRQAVWFSRKELASTSYSLNENFANETEYNRKKLYPIFKAARQLPEYEKVFLVEDTLIVDNNRYTVDTIHLLPTNLHPRNYCCKSNNDTLVFGGIMSEHNCFSNWSPAEFEFENFQYKNLEQAYMRHKAIENGDVVAERKLRYETNPRRIKQIGSAIHVTDKRKWEQKRDELMLNLVRAKFTQNDEMKQELMDTNNKQLGEAGKDMHYAVGLPFTHPRILDTGTWKGKTHLGKCLQIVRSELKA